MPNDTQRAKLPDISNQPDRSTARNSSKKYIAFSIAFTAVLVIIGAVGMTYANLHSPERLLRQAVLRLSKEQSLAFDFTAANGTAVTRGDLSYQKDSEKPEDFEATASIAAEGVRISSSLRSVSGTWYVRVDGLDKFSGLASPQSGAPALTEASAVLIESLSGRWFSFRPESVSQLVTGNASGETAHATRESDIQTIMRLYEDNQFIIAEDKGNASIKGTETRHLSLKIDHDTLLRFMKKLKDANLKTVPVSEANLQRLQRDARPHNEKLRVEAWIEKDEGTFKQLKLYTIDAPQDTLTLTARPTIGVPFDAKTPEKAEDLTPLLQLLASPPAGRPQR